MNGDLIRHIVDSRIDLLYARAKAGFIEWDEYHEQKSKIVNKLRYDSGFTKSLKLSILNRDKHRCRGFLFMDAPIGQHPISLGVRCSVVDGLEVHHIDGDFTNNSLSNLIILCKKHHKIYTKWFGNFQRFKLIHKIWCAFS